MNTIQAEDCLNGTWFQDLGLVDYNTLTRAYLQYRHDPDRYQIIFRILRNLFAKALQVTYCSKECEFKCPMKSLLSKILC
jgi:hypothetical protein